MKVCQGALTQPCPVPYLNLFLRPTDFHPPQILAWPWPTWIGSSRYTRPAQTPAAARGNERPMYLEERIVSFVKCKEKKRN